MSVNRELAVGGTLSPTLTLCNLRAVGFGESGEGGGKRGGALIQLLFRPL